MNVIQDVPVHVGDKTYTLRLGTNAMCRLEQRIETSVNAEHFLLNLVAASAKGSPRIQDVRLALWAALGDHHPDLTEEHAGQLIDDAGSMEVIARALAATMQAALMYLYASEGKS